MNQNGTVEFPYPAEQDSVLHQYDPLDYRMSAANQCQLLSQGEQRRLVRLIESQAQEFGPHFFNFMNRLSLPFASCLEDFVLSTFPSLLKMGMSIPSWEHLLDTILPTPLSHRQIRLLIDLAATAMIKCNRHEDLFLLLHSEGPSCEVLRLALSHNVSLTDIQMCFGHKKDMIKGLVDCFQDQMQPADLRAMDTVTLNTLIYEMPEVWLASQAKFIYALCCNAYFYKQQVRVLLTALTPVVYTQLLQQVVDMIADAIEDWSPMIRLVSALPADRTTQGLQAIASSMEREQFRRAPTQLVLLSLALAMGHIEPMVDNPFAFDPSCETLVQLAAAREQRPKTLNTHTLSK